MKSLLSAIGKWFLAQSIAVKALIAVVGVAVVAGAGTAAYVGIRSSNKPTNNNTIVTDKPDTTQTSKPDDSAEVSDNKDANSDKSDSTQESEASESEPSESTPDITPGLETEDGDNDADTEEVAPFVKTSTDLINGTFADGINGFEVYAFSEDAISYTADAKNGFQITISDTGSEDWHVQLKQSEIKLEKGKWYRLSLDAKSTINRNITSVMQRNGLYDDVWTPYSKSNLMAINNTWNTFTTIFQMSEATDEDAVFNVSMGTINGASITKEHTISLRNIKLEVLPDSWLDSLKNGANLIANGDFGYQDILWDASVVAPGASTVSFDNNKAIFNITNPGTVDWHVQLKQNGISLKKDTGYRLTFKAVSSSSRTIKVGFMDTNYVDWYGGADIALAAGQTQLVTVEFKNSIATNPNAIMMISMGKIEGQNTPASFITLSDFVLVEAADVQTSTASNSNWKDPNTVLPYGFTVYDHESRHTSGSYYGDAQGYVIRVGSQGHEDWHIQMQKKNVLLEKDCWYTISFDAKSTVNRPISYMLQRDGALDDKWDSYSKADGTQFVDLTGEWQHFTQTFKMTAETDAHTLLNFGLGYVNNTKVTDPHEISLRNIQLEKTTAPAIKSIEPYTEMLEKAASTYVAEDQNAAATVTYDGKKVIYDITKPGTQDWHVQYKYSDLTLEKGCIYEFSIYASSTIARSINVGFMNGDDYDWYGGATLKLIEPQADPAKGNLYSFRFTMEKETTANAILQISLGKLEGESTPASVITLNDASLMKVEAEPETPDDPDEDLILGRNLLKNGDFADGEKSWEAYYLVDGDGSKAIADKKAQFDITNVGTDIWHVQLKQTGLTLKKGSTYLLSYKITSSTDRGYVFGLQNAVSYQDHFGEGTTIPAKEEITVTKKFTMNDSTDDNVVLYFNLGGKDVTLAPHTITITDVKLCKVLEKEGDDDEFIEDSDPDDDPDDSNDDPVISGNTVTIKKAGWSEAEIPVATLVGDNDISKITAIKFTGDMNYAVGYTNTEGGWTGYADDADRTTTYTCKDILLQVSEINGNTTYPAFKIGIYIVEGTHTVSWEVITSEDPGDDPEDPVKPNDDPVISGNTVTIKKAGWSEAEIPVATLVGDNDISKITAIKFTGDMIYAVGYTNTEGGWTGYADDADRTTTYTCKDILLQVSEINGNTTYPAFKIGIYIVEGTHTVSWEVITSEDPGDDPEDPVKPNDDPVISGNTVTIKKAGWSEPEISIATLIGDNDISKIKSIKFTGDVNYGVAYNNAAGDWTNYVPDAERTTTYDVDDIDLQNPTGIVKIGIYIVEGIHTVSWEVITSSETPKGNSGSVTIDTLGWSEPQIEMADILGNNNPADVKSITFTSDINFGVGYINIEGGWTGYVDDSERTNKYTLSDILLAETDIDGERKYPTVKIGIYIVEGSHELTWQVNLK